MGGVHFVLQQTTFLSTGQRFKKENIKLGLFFPTLVILICHGPENYSKGKVTILVIIKIQIQLVSKFLSKSLSLVQ